MTRRTSRSRIRKNSEMQQFELKSAYSDPSAAH